MSAYNRRIFEVNGLMRQAHTIVVTYTSDGDKTPLVVSDFMIEGGTNLRVPSTGSGTSTGTTLNEGPSPSTAINQSPSTSSITPGVGRSSKPPAGAIVGGVLGAIAVLLLLFFLGWYWRRRRIQLRQSDDKLGQPLSDPREGQRGIGSAPPTAIYRNLPDSPSHIPASFHHPAARSKGGPAFVVANSDISYTDPNFPSTPSQVVFHYDNGVRLPTREIEAGVDVPPLYTPH